MRDQDEDAAWREIVENYGERATIDADPARPAGPTERSEPAESSGPAESSELSESSESSESSGPSYPGDMAEPAPSLPDDDVADDPEPSPYLDAPQERYVPPPPPPLPRPQGVRGLAWLGLFGSPLVLLVCVVAGIALPRLVTWALVVGFVAGFAHLVWTMPRGPRDPFDDGARV